MNTVNVAKLSLQLLSYKYIYKKMCTIPLRLVHILALMYCLIMVNLQRWPIEPLGCHRQTQTLELKHCTKRGLIKNYCMCIISFIMERIFTFPNCTCTDPRYSLSSL